MAAAQEGWGEDGSQPAQYDPVVEAQEDWTDDKDQAVTEVPATDETPADEVQADVPEEDTAQAAAVLDNEEGQVTRDKKVEMHLDDNSGCIDSLRRFEQRVVHRNLIDKMCI